MDSLTVVAKSVADWYIERHRRLIAPSTLDYSQKVVLSRAKGTRFWDVNGKEYLDFDGSVAVAAIGHNHPKIAEFDQKQQEILDFAESGGRLWCFTVEVAGKKYEISEAAFAETLIPLAFPECKHAYAAIPTVSGKHAVEIAAALAFKSQCVRPGRNIFIAFEKQFSGRIGWAGAFSRSKPIQKKHFPAPGFIVEYLPFPETYEDFVRAREMLNFIPLDSVNAILCEYIQGEGGMNSPAQPLFHNLLDLILAEGALLIHDEVQSGLGRTGKWFSYQHDTHVPDIVLVGKALGAGIAMSAVIYRKSIFEEKHDEILEQGWLGGTYHGYPKGIGRALLVLDILKEEGLVERASIMGDALYAALNDCARGVRGAYICIPKGIGLMRGLEFRKMLSRYRMPHMEERNRALAELAAAHPIGILTLPAGLDTINPTIRFVPPLVITGKEIDYLRETLTAVVGRTA